MTYSHKHHYFINFKIKHTVLNGSVHMAADADAGDENRTCSIFERSLTNVLGNHPTYASIYLDGAGPAPLMQRTVSRRLGLWKDLLREMFYFNRCYFFHIFL